MFLRDKKILIKAKNDDDFMDELIRTKEAEKFIKYVIKTFTKNPARFMQQHRVEWEDLYQACLIGLFNGIKRLNLELSTNEWVRFVYLTIQGEIRNFSRSNNSNSITISQRIRAMYPKYLLFYRDYWEKYNQDPTIKQTMEYFGISRDDTFDLVYGMQPIISMAKKRNSKSGELTFAESLRDPYQNVERRAINHVLIESYMAEINNTQQAILYMHYYIGLNKSEIAKVIGCGNSMINKHIAAAFKKIRQHEESQKIS
ncbi:sigma-70 family RNA polymerase sigma factor [Neobacillus novalis]|uniref:Sigma-70 family RNA polymerase sigma factor n=1 Tax=Neobacillus novalis TaxID=220687 RepID=A0AA95S6Q2_9BACI|nr:sigma-70 family RNA polymerase sigma factor [Neobacillus novalis]WHY83925.1 sigma-70 family RNA polymerase sigma factor [Neobacillus novalis]